LQLGVAAGVARVETCFPPNYLFPVPRQAALHDWRTQGLCDS